MTVKLTFEGGSMDEVVVKALNSLQPYAEQANLACFGTTTAAPASDPNPEGNGVSKEDVVVHEDVPLDNDAVLHCALDLLMTIYSSDDDKASVAVNELLHKYNVDSLNDVEPEKASELFKDAEKIASDFGVNN